MLRRWWDAYIAGARSLDSRGLRRWIWTQAKMVQNIDCRKRSRRRAYLRYVRRALRTTPIFIRGSARRVIYTPTSTAHSHGDRPSCSREYPSMFLFVSGNCIFRLGATNYTVPTRQAFLNADNVENSTLFTIRTFQQWYARSGRGFQIFAPGTRTRQQD